MFLDGKKKKKEKITKRTGHKKTLPKRLTKESFLNQKGNNKKKP